MKSQLMHLFASIFTIISLINAVSIAKPRLVRSSSATTRTGFKSIIRTSSGSALNLMKDLEPMEHSIMNNAANVITRQSGFLHDACVKGDLHLVKVLIEDSGLVPTQDTLNMASYSGNVDLVKYLVDSYGLLPERSTLIAASYSGSIDLVKYLVDDHHLIPEKEMLDGATNRNVYSFLYRIHLDQAFQESFFNQVQNVFSDSMDSFLESYQERRNLKALNDAILGQNYEQIKKLILQEGVEPDYPMLHNAALSGNQDIFDIILQYIPGAEAE